MANSRWSDKEWEQRFDVLFNNITSNQAPGLLTYEKCVLLTKGQDEVIKNHLSPNSQGNTLKEGFDGSAKRQIEFSTLTTISTITDVSEAARFDPRENSRSIDLPSGIMAIVSEIAQVTRNDNKTDLVVKPLRFDEYNRLMSRPYARPLERQAWRLISSDGTGRADIVVGPVDTLTKYTVSYIRKPKPIIIGNLEGMTLDGYTYGEGENQTQGCELDPILYEEILQRAIELAKVAWTSTGAESAQMIVQTGQRSE